MTNILIIDNDVDHLSLVKATFQSIGSEVRILAMRDTSKVSEYLEIGLFPDIILLDWYASPRNGESILKQIKSHTQLRALPIIVMSKNLSENTIRECYEQGASAYVPKPGNLESYFTTFQGIMHFWITIARVPKITYTN